MINGNRLKFGYGDICVGSDGLIQRMSFQQFKPHAECGGNVPEDIEYIGEEVVLQINYNNTTIIWIITEWDYKIIFHNAKVLLKCNTFYFLFCYINI